MAGGAIRHLVIAGLAASALSGCLDGFGKKSDTAPAAATPTPLLSRAQPKGDVEAPELFQANDMALWDGRPSLGGVWVAASDVKDPERVIMRNPANGKSVVGALFRRERENPGPRLQLSSDAAEALGLLAGQPARISVVALKQAATAPASEAAPAPTAPEASKDGAAIAKATSAALAKPAPAPVPAPVKAPAKPAAKGAVAASPVAAPAAPVKAVAAPPAATPAPVPAPTAAGTRIVQIGTFSVEANARQVADRLGKAGVATVIRKGQAGGKDHWSVNATGNDGTALLAKVKSLGFADAFLIK